MNGNRPVDKTNAQPSWVMQMAAQAAERVKTWSKSKQDYARRILQDRSSN